MFNLMTPPINTDVRAMSILFVACLSIYRYTYMELLMLFFKGLHKGYWDSVLNYWATRKNFQHSIYAFNLYHECNFYKRRRYSLTRKYFYNYTIKFVHLYTHKRIKVFFRSLCYDAVRKWYFMCWFLWVLLTIHLYFHTNTRDLGPSYDIYDYNPEDDMGIYLTIGPFLLLSWFCWTISADTVFVKLMQFILGKLFIYIHSKIDWYVMTIHSFIENASFYFFSNVFKHKFIYLK